jgi:2-amino-4-hydroxy-6-hydroxymethyldihydropteridine diphosphokinase
MSRVYLSLGSNLGNRKHNLENAVAEIGRCCGEITACSSFYATAPWGFLSPNEFINIAVAVTTSLEPATLLDMLQNIERNAGRQAKSRNEYEDRPLDIDILFYDDKVLQTERLTIPHPHLHRRLFVLIPLAEIAPLAIHPVLQKTVSDLLLECPDHSQVVSI